MTNTDVFLIVLMKAVHNYSGSFINERIKLFWSALIDFPNHSLDYLLWAAVIASLLYRELKCQMKYVIFLDEGSPYWK